MSIPRSESRRWRWVCAALVGCLALLGGTLSSARGQEGGQMDTPPLRLTAFAVNLGQTPTLRQPRSNTGTVEITIDRWSTDAERDELLAALQDHGENGLLKALQENPRVGGIRSTNSLAWDLHYARERRMPDGSRRIFIATDRPISIWEAANLPRSIHYPFTLIEIRLGPDGRGEGKLSIATRITIDRESRQIELENYATQPVRLQNVRLSR
jgi:hypothetical protein